MASSRGRFNTVAHVASRTAHVRFPDSRVVDPSSDDILGV